MKKISFSFKSLLVAAGLLIGSANAWADATTIYTKALSGWSNDDVTTTEGTVGKWYNSVGIVASPTATGITIDEDKGLRLCASRATPTATLKLDHVANSIVTVDAVWNVGSADNDANTPYVTFSYGDLTVRQNVRSNNLNTYYTINGRVVNPGDNKFARDDDMTIHLKVNSFTREITEFYIKNGETFVAQFSDLTSANNVFAEGAAYDAVTLLSCAPASSGGQRAYSYLKSITVTEEAQTVYSYTVNAKAGETVLKTLTTGLQLPEATISYYYNQMINYNGTLYQANAINSGYKTDFTLDADNKVVNHTYSQPATPVTNVVFLAEGEDIFTRGTGSSANIRCSMGAGGYASEKTAFVTLPAGTYHLCGVNRGGDSDTKYHKFYLGSAADPFFQTTGAGYNAYFDSGEFTLDETTVIYMQGGDNNKYVDWLYIYGTPENEIIGAMDCSTGYLTDMTNKVTLSPGESYNYKFINHNSGSSSQWLNYVVPVYTSADVKTLVIRSDNWEDVKGTDAGCTNNFVWGDANATFIEEMNGATVDMTISYNASNVLTMNAAIKTKSGYDWTYSYRTDYSGSGISLEGDIKVALSVSNSWAEVLAEGKVVSETLNTIMLGYKTFYNETTNYKVDANTTIYKAAAPSDGKVVLTAVSGNVIEAGQPVILKTSATTIEITPTDTEASGDFTGNALEVAAGTEVNKYVLGHTTTNGFGFYYYTTTLPAGYIYLDGDAPSPGVKALSVVVDGTATGIEAAPAVEETEEEGVLYNTAGQVVSKDYKGIVIKNGKKYINK